MRTRKIVVSAAILAGAMMANAASLTLTKGNVYTRSSSAVYPQPLSGITYAGGNSYYTVSDNGATYGLYTCTINLSEDGKTINSFQVATTNNAVKPSGTSDLEGVAYDPSSGNVWMADESKKTIKEYNPTTGAAAKSLTIPDVMKQNASNYGFESLTISGDGLTLWTSNEEGLTCDDSVSSYSKTTVVRLNKYTRPSVNSNFTLAAMYPYVTDKWRYSQNVSNKARHGVADLCALPDGSLLVLERDLSFSSSISGTLTFYIYHVDTSGATDVQNYSSLSNGVAWTAASKTLLASEGKSLFSYGNFEGICLGPRLSNGNLSILLMSDAGDGYSEPMIYPLVLSGLNVRTLAFTTPASGTSSIVGSNYRYLNGAAVNVSLEGVQTPPMAYTNNNATLTDVTWTAEGQSSASGSGANATFTVSGDGTFAWAWSQSSAVSSLLANDSFEAYAAGTQGSDIPGWSGEDAEVVATNYSSAAGYPMDRETHTKVLSVDGDLTRTYPEVETNALQKLDFMVAVRHAPPGNDIAVPGSAAGNKLIVACNSNGVMCVRCTKPGGTAGWVELSGTAYENDDWVRVTLTFDYSSNSGGRAFAQVKLNGTECPTASGYASPTDLTTGGSWYELLDIGEKRCVTALVASGMCKLDDIMLSIEDVAEPAYIDGVPVAWLDALGLGRDPNLVFPANVKPNLSTLGYTLGDAFAAGIDLSKDEPFQLIDIKLLDDRRLRLTFNGVRDDKALSEVYHVYGMERLGDTETLLSGTCEAGEGQTTWTSESATNPTNGFFRVRATR